MKADVFIPRVPDPVPPPQPRRDRENREGVQQDIARADKVARTGSAEEKIRSTPPAGAWNDTSHD